MADERIWKPFIVLITHLLLTPPSWLQIETTSKPPVGSFVKPCCARWAIIWFTHSLMLTVCAVGFSCYPFFLHCFGVWLGALMSLIIPASQVWWILEKI